MKTPSAIALARTALLVPAAALCLFGAACKEKKETILDIETPNGGIKVEQDKESGAVDVKVEE